MNFMVQIHVSGTGRVEKWFKTYWGAVLYRLWNWAGWVDNGLQTKEQVEDTKRYLRERIPDRSLTDGRY